MGIRLDILRGTYDSTCNAFHGCKGVTLVGYDGPWQPTPDYPAAYLLRDVIGDGVHVVPEQGPGRDTHAGPMDGGTWAWTMGEGLQTAIRSVLGLPPRELGLIGYVGHAYGPLRVHDRYETWEQYRVLSD